MLKKLDARACNGENTVYHLAFHVPLSRCLPRVLFNVKVGELDSNEFSQIPLTTKIKTAKYSCNILNHETTKIFNCINFSSYDDMLAVVY